jgi:beta-glucanase (GH16 family)
MKILLWVTALFHLSSIFVQAGNWKLVWSDEFNYQGLPDPAKWTFEEGFLRNHESQYYTQARLENCRVEHGNLVIECRQDHFAPTNHAPVQYTSASITTKYKASWQYGRIEVRAKIPQGKGVWPAIWTLGTNVTTVGWPRCGEIDIMEFVGKQPDHIYGTIHYALQGKPQANQGSFCTRRPVDGFHRYAIEWTPERIDFYFDEHKYHSVLISQAGPPDRNPFCQPHFIILNFALGGDWGGPIDDAKLPQKFLIDYVRVYQANPGR